jgi:hypothetical protein
MKFVGIGIALVISAFFLVNLVPFPHQSSTSPTTENLVSGISAHQFSLFGFNTPGIPTWTFTTSDAILILAAAAFARDGYAFWEEHH